MSTLDLLDLLRRKDVKIWEEGDQVHINAPKGTLTPDLQAQIREFKQELVALLRETAQKDSSVGPPILSSLRGGPLPLSFAQERLWFFDKLQPGNPAYNISSAFSLSGSLNLAAFTQALQTLVDRHEVLRTTFPSQEDGPIQQISSDVNIEVQRLDYGHLSEHEQTMLTQQMLEQEAQTFFKLAQGPLWRLTVVRYSDTRWALMLVIHHILADAWSLEIFLKELLTLYQGIIEEKSPHLPPVVIQYGDFARWQRKEHVQKYWDHQLTYWKKQLSGCPMFLDLPCDRPRPSEQSFQGGRVSFAISKDLRDALSEIGRGEGATTFMTLLAAFQTLLFRYSGQEEFLVGVPVAGRNKEEVASTIGLFVNTVVLRANLSGSPSFTELLAQVRRVALEAFANQELPFEQVVTALHPERTLSHNPLFQVMFAYHNFSQEEKSVLDNVPGLDFSPLPFEARMAKFDLTLFIEERGDGLSGGIEYRTDLFDESTIRRMAGHFQNILQGVVVNPRQSIMSIPLLTSSERHQVLVEWNATTQSYPDLCLHQLFEGQVDRTPDAGAVTFRDTTVSYEELNQRANRLAHFLRKSGVGPEVLVGIYLNRSIDMMVALLGVLKAGGAYIPLDLSTPKERLRLIVEESRMMVLLTETELCEHFPARIPDSSFSAVVNGEGAAIDDFGSDRMRCNPTVVCLDAMGEKIFQVLSHNMQNLTSPDNLAYVIYTSGSTGYPKGVMIPHRGLVNYLNWSVEAYDVQSGAGALVHSSIGFDMAVTSLFAPLLVGKTVELLPQDADIDALANAVITQPARSFLKLTPSHLDMLSYRMPDRKPSVHRVILGGETLQGHTVQTWRGLAPSARVVNEYGPTEAVVGCCVYEAPRQDVPSGPLPIGRPISNVQLFILDPIQQPVPIGVPGELYIGGHGLARGYMNQPELTKRTFIKNPFGDATSTHLYKTGDRCRYRDDGTIEFLGRLDRQVKLRGFRIELSEVEAVLCRHPAVCEAVVIFHDQAVSPMLGAYIVPSSSVAKDIDDLDWNESAHCSVLSAQLQVFLHDWLPSYMVPSTFHILKKISLTPNGKVDYGALPELGPRLSVGKEAFVGPGDGLEAQFVSVWEQVLDVKPIGVHDNFFDLGGHSFLAVQLWSRMEKMAGKSLPLSLLYRLPTIAQLAQVVRQQEDRAEWEYLVAVQPEGHHAPLCIVPGAGDPGLYLRNIAKHLGVDQPLYGFHAQGIDGKKPFHDSVNEMAAHYVQDLRQLQPQGPYFLGGYSFGGIVAYEMAQQLQYEGQSVALLALFDTPGPAYRRRVATKRKAESILNWMTRHGRVLRTLRLTRQVDYVAERFIGWWKGWLDRKIHKSRRWGCYLFRLLRLPVPLALRSYYMQFVVSEEVKARYHICPFAGPVTLFHANETSSMDEGLGWKGVAFGGLEIISVAGKHTDLVKEPYVQGLAKHLRECLERARTKFM
jgi:amino acid adenylation domain-containing protein